jgi:putative ABC transport system substrate-binding protein
MLKGVGSSTPVVFVNAADPVTSGLVESMARPGANLTGFTNYEFPIGGKWLSMLLEVSPATRRVLVLMPTGTNTGIFRNIEESAKPRHVGVEPFTDGAPSALERKLVEFGREPGAGLIVMPSPRFLEQRELITTLALRHRMPAIYHHRLFVASGGLMSYGIDNVEQYRKAAGYVARILRGDNPATLPVQAPTKFEFVINLKTANELGLTIPLPLIGGADEFIE